MADTIVDLERKYYIQQLGLSAGQASALTPQDLDAQIDSRAYYAIPSASNYKPNNTIAENMPRSYIGNTSNGAYLSGRLQMYPMYLTAGMSITSIVWTSGTTLASAQTNLWAAFFAPDLTKIAVSQDELTNMVPATTERVFNLVGGPYVIATTGMYYVGVCFVGTGTPTPLSFLGNAVVNVLPPNLNAQSNQTGLTTPASCPNTVVLFNTGNAIAYLQVR